MAKSHRVDQGLGAAHRTAVFLDFTLYEGVNQIDIPRATPHVKIA